MDLGARTRIFISSILSKMPFLFREGYQQVNYAGGNIYLDLKESEMMRQRALGGYEPRKTELFKKIVKPGMTIIDIGSNKGYYSLLSAKLSEDRGTVLAFEPDPDNRYWLKKSIEANGYKSIEIFPVALSDSNGDAVFYKGKRSGWGSMVRSVNNTGQEIKVKTRKLDDLLKERKINKVDIIKIDVEGADLLVLKGAENTLKGNLKLIMDIDVKNSDEKRELFVFLKSLGLSIYEVGEELREVRDSMEGVKEIYVVRED